MKFVLFFTACLRGEEVAPLEKFNDFQIVDELYQQENPIKEEKVVHKEKEVFQKEELIPFQAMLRKETIVYDVKTKKNLKIPRQIYVWVAEQGEEGLSVIYDKKKEQKYLVNTKELLPLKPDTDLMPEDYNSVNYTRPFDINNKNTLPLETSVNLYWEWLHGDFFADLYDVEVDENTLNSSNLSGKIFPLWEMPMKIGMGISYKNSTWISQEADISNAGLFIGPVIAIPVSKYKDIMIDSHLVYQKSIVMKSVLGNIEHDLSSNIFRLELQGTVPLSEGFFIMGLSCQYIRTSVKKSNIPLFLDSPRNTIKGIGIFAGYGFEIEL